jgi:outer membrane receptor protein involved in Fe transport
VVLLGAETRFIKGSTQETRLAQGQFLGASDAGGTQQINSVFAQDTIAVNDKLTIVASAHGDQWHTKSKNTTYDKTLGSFNPRAAVAYSVARGLSIRGSAYGGFRAPTLNELYRDFRAGNTQTNHNEALEPERLKGADGGLFVARGNASARVTGFWNQLDDVITNITLATTPTLITKQRQNADKLRSSGIEMEGEVRLPAAVAIQFTTGMVNARFKGDTSLRNNRVPQVPEFNMGAGLRYDGRPWSASAQFRLTGLQYEDDLNVYALRRATVFDLFGRRTLGTKASVFVAVENVFDAKYDVGRTPILTIGMPRAGRTGVQVVF